MSQPANQVIHPLKGMQEIPMHRKIVSLAAASHEYKFVYEDVVSNHCKGVRHNIHKRIYIHIYVYVYIKMHTSRYI